MVDLNVLDQILSVRNGVWGMVLAIGLLVVRARHVLPALMERFNERRRDSATIEAARFERMDHRLERLEQREEECQARLAEALGRIAELEGYNVGRGKADQEAAGIVAGERADPGRATTAAKRFGVPKKRDE